MSKKGKSSKNFLVQGSILAVASIISRIIGLVYRIPLTNILGDEGISYYSMANQIYNIVLMIASFSLPLAVSKLMAERIQKGEYRNANRVFLCAVRFAVVTGAVLSLLTYILAGVLTNQLMNLKMAKYALRVLAPAIFVFAITGTFRGFFQGHSTMVPTAISQVIEQIVHAIVTLVCANIMFDYGLALSASQQNDQMAPALGAAGATFGTVVSVTVALLFMMAVYTIYSGQFRRLMKADTSTHRESSAYIYRLLVMTILPIVLSTLIYNISNVLDQGIFDAILKGQGYTETQYATIWGVYIGKFNVLMNVPLSLASCLGPAVVPSLTAAVAARNRREAVKKVGMSIRFTMILTIPCAFGLAALGGPIVELLFHPTTGLPLAEEIMRSGAIMIVFYALSTLSTSILQGLGKLKIPLVNSGIALVVHLICLVVLMRNFNLNIFGVVHANTIFALIICILNGLAIKRCLSYRQEFFRTFLVPTVVSIIMAFGAYGLHALFDGIFGNTVATVLAILGGIVIYAIALVSFHGITAEELAALPKGKMLVRFFRKLGLLR